MDHLGQTSRVNHQPSRTNIRPHSPVRRCPTSRPAHLISQPFRIFHHPSQASLRRFQANRPLFNSQGCKVSRQASNRNRTAASRANLPVFKQTLRASSLQVTLPHQISTQVLVLVRAPTAQHLECNKHSPHTNLINQAL